MGFIPHLGFISHSGFASWDIITSVWDKSPYPMAGCWINYNGHTSTLDNSSGFNSFPLNASDFLRNQTCRPNVTYASRIQTDQGNTTLIDFYQFMSSMKVMFCESVQPSIDAINKMIDSIVTTSNYGNGKRSLVTSNSAYPPAKRLDHPSNFQFTVLAIKLKMYLKLQAQFLLLWAIYSVAQKLELAQ